MVTNQSVKTVKPRTICNVWYESGQLCMYILTQAIATIIHNYVGSCFGGLLGYCFFSVSNINMHSIICYKR